MRRAASRQPQRQPPPKVITVGICRQVRFTAAGRRVGQTSRWAAGSARFLRAAGCRRQLGRSPSLAVRRCDIAATIRDRCKPGLTPFGGASAADRAPIHLHSESACSASLALSRSRGDRRRSVLKPRCGDSSRMREFLRGCHRKRVPRPTSNRRAEAVRFRPSEPRASNTGTPLASLCSPSWKA
jgi:hypothetical protein